MMSSEGEFELGSTTLISNSTELLSPLILDKSTVVRSPRKINPFTDTTDVNANQRKEAGVRDLQVVLKRLDNATIFNALKIDASPTSLLNMRVTGLPSGSVGKRRKQNSTTTRYGRVVKGVLQSQPNQGKPSSPKRKRTNSTKSTTSFSALDKIDNPSRDLTPMLQALGLQRRTTEVEVLTNPTTVQKALQQNPLPNVISYGSHVEINNHPKASSSKVVNNTKNTEGSAPKKLSLTCFMCLNVFSNRGRFNIHRRSQCNHNQCPDCGWKAGSYVELKRHVSKKITNGTLALKPTVKLPARKLSVKPAPIKKPSVPRLPESSKTNKVVSLPPMLPGLNQLPWAGGMVTMEKYNSRNTEGDDDIYPPHFMESFLEVESPESQSPRKKESELVVSQAVSRLTPDVIITHSTGPVRHNGYFLSTSQASSGVAVQNSSPENSLSLATFRIPPTIISSVALPTVSTVVGPKLGITNGIPPYTLSSSSGFKTPNAPPTFRPRPELAVNSSPKMPCTSDDFTCYEDLLEPLNKVKKFAMERKDGAIIFTIHELEKHIFTTMLAEPPKKAVEFQ